MRLKGFWITWAFDGSDSVDKRPRYVFDVARSRSNSVGADLSANAVFQPPHMRRMYWPFRGQVRSHKTQFIQ